MWVWRWVDGTKQGWSSPGKPVCSFTARPPSQPGIAPPPEFPKAFQPAAPPQDKEKAEDKDNTLGGTHQGGSGFAVLVVLGQFWPQLWRAFPTSQSRLLTCSCCCSSPSAPDQRPVTTKASLAILLTRSCSQVTMCPQTGLGQEGLAGKQENSGAGEKGNLRARWPCVFNWLLGKAEKVMCTNQSRIKDQSESEFRPPRPIRS